MKKADAIIQSLLLLAIITAAFCLFIDAQFFYLIFYIYIGMIIWQVLSAIYIISSDAPGSVFKKAKRHFLLTLFFFTMLSLSCASAWCMWLCFACSCSVSISYFILTIKRVFIKPRRKTFLDII